MVAAARASKGSILMRASMSLAALAALSLSCAQQVPIAPAPTGATAGPLPALALIITPPSTGQVWLSQPITTKNLTQDAALSVLAGPAIPRPMPQVDPQALQTASRVAQSLGVDPFTAAQVFGTIPASVVDTLVAALKARGIPLAGPVTYAHDSGARETLNVTVVSWAQNATAVPACPVHIELLAPIPAAAINDTLFTSSTGQRASQALAGRVGLFAIKAAQGNSRAGGACNYIVTLPDPVTVGALNSYGQTLRTLVDDGRLSLSAAPAPAPLKAAGTSVQVASLGRRHLLQGVVSSAASFAACVSGATALASSLMAATDAGNSVVQYGLVAKNAITLAKTAAGESNPLILAVSADTCLNPKDAAALGATEQIIVDNAPGLATKIGNGIANGAEVVGNGVVTGAEVVGNGVVTGANAVANGVSSVASDVSSAANVVGNAFKSIGCFPGATEAEVEQRGRVPMHQLRMGNRVKVLTPSGQVAWEPIIVFGHQDPDVAAPYVTLQAMSAQGHRAVLRLSPDHFVPVAPAGAEPIFSQTVMTRGRDVSPSDTLFLMDAAGSLVPARISAVSVQLARGAFNPYTASGTIVVGDVVASVHSRWFLDGLFDRLGWSSGLPAAYQVVFLPIRATWYVLSAIGGPHLAEAIDGVLGLSAIGHKQPLLFVGANVGVFAAACSLAVFQLAFRSKSPARI